MQPLISDSIVEVRQQQAIIVTENIEETESVENGAGLGRDKLNPSIKSHGHKK